MSSASKPAGKKNPPKKFRGKKKFGAAAAPTKIVVKPKAKESTAKGRRVLAEREPKVFEDTKVAMFVRGKNTGPLAREAMGDLYHLKMPFAIKYKRKNDIMPFEDPTSLEFFSNKSDASLLLFCNHNKKRPNNMIFARFFDYRLLDMVEVGVESYMPMVEFGNKPLIGAKPAIVLRGSAFETDAKVSAFGNVLIDFFRGTVTDEMNLEGLSHVIVVTAMDSGIIHFRVYMTKLKKSGTKLPHVELEECGPRIDWSMRRQQLADRDLRRKSMQRPLQAMEGKPKNITKTPLGDRVGRVHMEKQEFQGFQTRKMKGLKKRRTASGEQVTESEAPAALAPNDS